MASVTGAGPDQLYINPAPVPVTEPLNVMLVPSHSISDGDTVADAINGLSYKFTSNVYAPVLLP